MMQPNDKLTFSICHITYAILNLPSDDDGCKKPLFFQLFKNLIKSISYKCSNFDWVKRVNPSQMTVIS